MARIEPSKYLTSYVSESLTNYIFSLVIAKIDHEPPQTLGGYNDALGSATLYLCRQTGMPYLDVERHVRPYIDKLDGTETIAGIFSWIETCRQKLQTESRAQLSFVRAQLDDAERKLREAEGEAFLVRHKLRILSELAYE